MKTHVVIFEARGGSDKGTYGFRRDSKPIIDSLKKRGWSAEIIFYRDEDRGQIYRHTIEMAGAYISRVNPGNLKDETGYLQMLRELVRNGVEGLPHPDAMVNYGAKSSIERLRGTALVPADVYIYYTFDEFKSSFPQSLATGERVLKQNRGSTGEGIWRVSVDTGGNGNGTPTDRVPLDAKIKLTEAVDNHTELKTLGEFIDFCVKYVEGENGLLLDMPFLKRIVEGELRVMMLRDKPVHVVHKKPVDAPDAFSATLFSGAKYTYETPDKWPALIRDIEGNVKSIRERLGNYDLPLLWTADFILDTDLETGDDKYVLGEINASCVGFSTHLELSENIADEILKLMEAEDVVNNSWPAFSV